MWFDLISPCFFASCDLPIVVNQTPRLAEILCFKILCFARAFLSYSCLFPIPALLESSLSKKTLRGLSRSCCAVVHPSSATPTTEGSSTVGVRPPDYLLPPQLFFPAAGAMKTALPSSTEQMTSRTTRVRKRGHTLSCLLTLCIA